MADQSSSHPNSSDDGHAPASSSSPPPIRHDDHTTEDEDYYANDDCNNDNEPLLSSLFKKSVRAGPFSIRYNNPSSPRAKPSRLYEKSSSSGLYHDFAKRSDSHLYADNEDDEDDEFISHRHSKYHYILHRLQSTACCKKILPLRILFLAFYLAFTLSSFWILDSIKEPTLAILVDGELGKHQPRAKMVSFVVVVGLAVGMEWMDRMKQGRRRRRMQGQQHQQQRGLEDEMGVNAALEKSWADRNLPNSMREDDDNNNNGGSRWRKMGIRTSHFWKHFHWGSQTDDVDDETENSSSKITTVAFYIIGSLYIHAFVTVAIALRQHPSFRPNAIFHEVTDVADLAANGIDAYPSSDFNTSTATASTSNNWYYPTLGYVLFALIESFGSVSITIFWAFANSHLTLETAERHYGSIVALAQAGAISGSTLSAVLGRRRGEQSVISDAEGRVDISVGEDVEENDAQVTPILLFWAAGCIGCGMAIMALYSQLFSKPMRQSTQQLVLADTMDTERIDGEHNPPLKQPERRQQDDNEGSTSSLFRDLFGGVHMIFRHEYLKLVLAVSVLYEIALTCMHYEMNLIGLDRFGVGISIVDDSEFNGEHDYDHTNSEMNSETHQNGSDEGITYIQFMGWYGQTVNILSLFLSFYAFPRLIKNYGLRITIRIFPTVLLFVTICAFVLFPGNLYFLFISLSVCKALTYSIHDPSEEVLYMPTSDDAKFRAKFWIDVVGQRVAKALGSAINNYAGSVEGIVKYGSLPSVVASLALWLACYQVGQLFDGLIKSGNVVGSEEEERYDEGLELHESIEKDGGENDDVGLEDEIIPTTSERRSSQLEMTNL
ncbi:hypothetical protein ACHAXR_005352 [Thalassiosira sp. AJA248-18]